MSRQIYLAILALLCLHVLPLQATDTLVCFKDLSFQTDFERTAFQQLASGEGVCLEDLYLAISIHSEYEADRYRKQLAALRSSLKREGVAEKKDAKRIKTVYKAVHDALMVKYVEEALYPDLFRDGSFNCVSGTAVYSLMFDEFDIPYQIQKGKNHVYLLAFPETEPMLVESTDAEKGLRKYSASDQNEYVRQLERGKLISSQERNSASVEKLFLEYAFEESHIDELELASYQYLNQGIAHLREKNQYIAFRCFEKAYYLKPQEVTAVFLLNTGAFLLHQADYLDTADYHLLGKLSRYTDYGIVNNDIKQEFYRLTKEVYMDRKDSALYVDAYRILMDYVSDEELKDEITQTYLWIQIEELTKKGEFEFCLPLAEAHYEIDPGNEDLGRLVLKILHARLANLNGTTDYEAVMNSYYDLQERFPTMFRSTSMQAFECSMLLNCAEGAIDDKDPQLALQYIERAEARFGEGGVDPQRCRYDIERSYKVFAFYYYKRKQYTRARAILDRSLILLPESYELKKLRNSM